MRRTTPAVALGLVLLAVPAAAIPFDPFKIALLARIARTAAEIYRTVEEILTAAQEMKERAEAMFPDETLAEIGSTFQQVRSIQAQIEQLACDWRFSDSIQDLRRGLLKQVFVCKRVYQRALGKPAQALDADLEEYLQWSAARRLNTVADTFAVSDQWNDAARELARMARPQGTSAGFAQRLSAIGSALGLQQATLANKQAAELLSGVQEDLDLERQRDWRERVTATCWVAWMVEGQAVVRSSGVTSAPEGASR